MMKMPLSFASRFTMLAAALAGAFAGNSLVAQEPGSIDRSYTPAAAAVSNTGEDAAASVRSLVVQPDGKTIVAGRINGGTDAGRPIFVRLKEDGRLDRSFSKAKPDNNVNAVALTAQGQVLIGGAFTSFANGTAGAVAAPRFARLNADGSIDASFHPGAGADGTVRAVAVETDGRYLVGGSFSSFNRISLGGLARLQVDGSVDASFKPETGPGGAVEAVAVQAADGKVVAAGSFSLNGNSSRLVRLHANGKIDSSFQANFGVPGRVRAIAIQKDGKILIGGEFTSVNGVAQNGVARLNVDGSLDRTFNVGAGVGRVYALAVHPADGRVVITGDFASVEGLARAGVARLNTNGSIDRSFNPGTANALVRAVAFERGASKLVLGGDFTMVDGVVRGAVARLHTGEPAVHATASLVRGPVTRAAAAVGAPTLQFGDPTFTASENTGTAIIAVARTGDATAAASVNYATSDGTATAGSDYTATSGTLNWAAGDSKPKFFSVPLAVDGIAEPDETVGITLSAPVGATFAGNAATLATTLTITDEQPTFLQFSSASYSASEAAGTATITVTRSGGSNRAVTVYYQTEDDATGLNPATSGTDYTPVFGQLSWAAGDYSAKTFSVPIVIDSVSPESDETVLVDIMDQNGPAALGPRVQATLTIADVASSTVQFSGPNFTAREATGAATVIVTRSGGDGGAISVDYQTFDGDAVGTTSFNQNANADYIIAAGTLSWAQDDFSPKTISIVLNTNPPTPKPDISFIVALGNAVGNSVVGPQNQTTVTITESEPSTINFSASTYLASELQGTVRITATRTGGGFGAASVDYSIGSGTAQAGNDFTAVSGTLTWAAGDFSPKNFTVPITNDHVAEQDEVAILTLSNPGGLAVLGTISQATLTITDQPPASVQFVTTNSSVNENAGAATVTVTRTGSGKGAVSVDYSTADGTATANSDYTSVAGTITFADGDFTPQTITVPILADTVNESTETLTVNLSNVVGEAVIGSPSQLTLSIINTPTTALQFSSTTYTASENSPAGATITVTRSGDLSSAVSVDYTTSDGTATAGSDYVAATGTLTWAVGDSQPKTFVVPIIADNLPESPETVQLSLTRPVGPVLIVGGSATLTITDNPTATLQFTQATYSGTEQSPFGSITVAVSRVGNSVGAVSVNYSLKGITAIPGIAANTGADYLDTAGTLNWADGDTAPKTFVVTIFNDDVPESDETLQAILSAPLGAAVLGSPAVATLTIHDDDAASNLQFSATNYTVSEGAGFGVVTVNRSGSNVGSVSVDYVTTDGTATANSDYTPLVGTLTWAAGDLSPKSFRIPIINDTSMESAETVLLTLGNPTNGAVVGTRSTATLTIIDDDQPSTVQFSAATYNSPAGSTQATLTVTRLGGAGGALTVNYATANGTAVAGVDYSATSGTLSFAAGDATAKTILVPILNDSASSTVKNFTVALSAPAGTTLGTVPTATVTILGQSTPVVTVVAKQPAVTEGLGKGKFIITRTGGDINADLIVRFQFKGSAKAGIDFPGVGKKVTIPAGKSSVKVKITPLDDNIAESDEKAKLILTPTADYTVGSPSVAVIVVHDTTNE